MKLTVQTGLAVLLAAFMAAFLCQRVSAQATTGSVSGHVVDPAGKVVQGAQVAVRDVDTGIEATVATDQSGDFELTALPPGHYTIDVGAAGFATSTVPAFELNIDQKARFDISMKVGAVSSSVEVSDSAPILQTQGAETGQVIDGRELTDLPLEGRNFTSLMLLVPGVGTGGGGNNLNISVDGQREFSNSVEINGTEVTGNRNNDTNMVPSPDALQEFKMVTSTYAPEFGRASGGSVLIQTKSGTNDFHGSAYFFYRPTATAANPAVSPGGTIPTLEQKIYGATIGGPLLKNKAFIFLAFEGNRLAQTYSYFANTPPLNQVSFDAAGDADLSQLTDPYDGSMIPIFDP
ncbi:MAG: carboxypeptidase regulatory-like domain-containing protein, partial [Terracidiphilus sp.]